MMNPVKKFKSLDPEFRVYATLYATAAVTTVAGAAAVVYGVAKGAEAIASH